MFFGQYTSKEGDDLLRSLWRRSAAPLNARELAWINTDTR